MSFSPVSTNSPFLISEQISSSNELQSAIDTNNLKYISQFADQLNRPLPSGDGLPLLYAIQKNKKELIPELLKNGANPLQQEPDEPSPLEYAILAGAQEIIPLLVAKVTALELENVQKALETPADRKSIQKTATLIKTAYSDKQRLALASDLEKVLNGDQISLLTANNTLLHLVVQSGSLSLLQKSLEDPKYHHLINQANQDGLTPLHYATALNHLKMVECLCLAGAKTDAKDSHNLTPLMLVAANAEEHHPLNISLQRQLIFVFAAVIWVANRYDFIRNLSLEQHSAIKLIETGIHILPSLSSFSSWKQAAMNALLFGIAFNLQPEAGSLGIAYTSLIATLTALSAIKGLGTCARYQSLSTFQAIKKAIVVEGPKLVSSYHTICNVGAALGWCKPYLEDRLLVWRTEPMHSIFRMPVFSCFLPQHFGANSTCFVYQSGDLFENRKPAKPLGLLDFLNYLLP